MAVNKLTPRYLNKDDDSRLVKSTEMTDALNVRVSFDDDGNGLVIKNAYGNQEVTLVGALPAGTNKVIGSTANEQNGAIYYYVWNSNGDHSIYRYSVGANTSTKVYSDSVLGFTENGFVKGDVITSIDGDELLYFNDSFTAPKKINASKALRGQYPSEFTSGTDEEKLLFLTVAKQPPLDPPSYNIVNNPNLGENRISDKVFQFAYRYVYEDGEVSALSPYSSLTASVAQLRDGFNTQSAIDFYNQVNVFVRNSIADVEKIQVYAREGNEGTFYQIKEFDNNGTANPTTVNFTNSTIGEALSVTDKNKLYDNVPQLADSQEVASGRLMYGGYTEGYPNIEADVELLANYKKTEDIYNISLSATSTADNTKITFGSADLPSTFAVDSTVYFNVAFSGDTVTVGGASITDHIDFDSNYGVLISDLDGTNSEEVIVSRTKEPVTFICSGINISERVEIPAGSSSQYAIGAMMLKLASKKYDLMLSPTADQAVILNGSGTAFTAETARLNARAKIQPSIASTTEINLNIVGMEIYLGSFNENKIGGSQFFYQDKEKDIISASIITAATPLSYQYQNPYVLGSSFVSETNDSASKSFKSGSSHKLGIVYYDDRNRSGGVQELGDVYIAALNDRSLENDIYGPASVVMRVSNDAPSWAKRWAPVYKGQGSNKLKLMYGIDGAYAAFRTNSNLQNYAPINSIYLSLNSLFAKDRGYNDSTGADISYEFSKGDRLRVLKYDGDQRSAVEFKVLGLETFLQDDNNPILDTSSARTVQSTTGEFLIVEEDKNASGFTLKDIIERNSSWTKRCVIEIYNTNDLSADIYYEIGKSYDVINGVHSDERTATSLNITISERTGTLQNNFFGTSSVKLFKGDILNVASTQVTIRNAYTKGGVFYYYGDSKDNNPLPLNTYPATVDNPEKVIDLSLGDVYFRRRTIYSSVINPKLIIGSNAYRPTTNLVEYIEDYSVSDFFASKSSSIGRPIAYIPDAKTVKRSGSITYSEPYLQEGTFNGLSSFNLSLANFKDLAYEHGSIKGLVSYDERLYFIQENRSGVLAVNRSVIDTGSGDNLITLSKNVLQSEQYYVGEYGTSNPESVASRDGMVYFADVKRGKVLRIDSQGLTIISDVNLSSYFDDKFGIISSYQPSTVVGGMDKDNDEYIVSSDSITEATVAINTDEYVYTAQLDSSGTQVLAPQTINDLAVFNFNTEIRTFDSVCDEFQDSLEAIVFLDTLSDGGSIFTISGYEGRYLYGVATNSTYDFFVAITVDTQLPGFVFNNAYCTSDDVGSINPASSVLDAFTIAYSTDDRVWSTRYSFTPESIASVHNALYTFKSGKIYKHSEAASRNTFYGAATAESIVEAVSNAAPSAIKTFESLSLEGDTAWDATVTTTTQTAVIDDTSFKEKEGFYYAYIHGDTSSYGSQITSVTSTSEIFSLGVVGADVVSNNTITFSNAINTIAFPLGSTATLYKINGNQLDTLSVYPLSITGQKSLSVSGNISLSAGDLLVVVGNSAIEGDQIRDYFAQIKLTKTTSAPIELFAINASFADSKLHN